jgi:pimeloyl-ACP methyl ester carboxylesterase
MGGKRVRTPDGVIFLPGIMGSELKDARGDVVWGLRPSLVFRQIQLGDVLARLKLDEDASDDGVVASRLLRFPAQLPLLGGVEPYGKLVTRLGELVEAPEALRLFPYDWRRSIELSARQLEDAAAEHLAAWRKRRRELRPDDRTQPRLTLVCHSMGGLVARYAVEVLGGIKGDVRQIVTLGTPFRGSLKALRILATGEYLPLGILSEQLRDACRTLPGLYELLPRYKCMGEGDGHRWIEPSDLADVGARATRAEVAFATLARLAESVGSAESALTPVRPMVGVSQPTLQSATIAHGEASFDEQLGGIDEGGDGTVMRRSAVPEGNTPSYLPQLHGAIAKSGEALAYVGGVLTEDALGPLEAEPRGISVRIPDIAMVGQALTVDIQTPSGVPSCVVEDAETNLQIAEPPVTPRDGSLVATTSITVPGLYRVVVAGGGLSSVEGLVPVIAE